jgi:hypothetical protein
VTNATSSVDVIAYTSLFPSRPPQNGIHLDIGESVEIIRSDLFWRVTCSVNLRLREFMNQFVILDPGDWCLIQLPCSLLNIRSLLLDGSM